jgi:hypothetical protein
VASRRDAADRAPRSLPPGFALATQLSGSVAGGFPGTADQLAMVYTRGRSIDDFRHPFTVYFGPAGTRALAATEERQGVPVDIGIDGAVATYHDGWWAIGPGEDQRRFGRTTAIHWDRSNVHSITLHTATQTIGVRGSRASGVAFRDLLQAAKSLPGL